MAFKTGFEVAGSTDIIVTTDPDGQHNPADIPKLVTPSSGTKLVWLTAVII